LIVKVGRDDTVAPDIADAMHAHIKGSELISSPEAPHRVQITNSKELIPAIRDFITRRGKE
jgi:pimeloyl-ACP methyl ester carboxylesterase